jgi:hypothetical protein
MDGSSAHNIPPSKNIAYRGYLYHIGCLDFKINFENGQQIAKQRQGSRGLPSPAEGSSLAVLLRASPGFAKAGAFYTLQLSTLPFRR